MIGRTVGNYVIRKLIGKGGMGAVYLAEHPRIERRVAVKMLLPELGRDHDIVERFFNEARAANAIGNEHIVDIHDFGEMEDGTSYFIMEWLNGRSLGDLIDLEKRLALPRALHILDGAGRALTAAHAAGIIHRDLKPDNIFLVARENDAEFVKVLDFGIAKLLQGDQKVKTRTDAIMGTLAYMSPEQCKGGHTPIDARSDVYSLGIIVYEMLTGQVPFHAEGYGGMLLCHMMDAPPPPRSLNAEIPPAVEEAILRCLAKAPDDRFRSVEEMVGAMYDAAGLPLPSRTAAVVATAATEGGIEARVPEPTGAGERRPRTGIGRRRSSWILGGAVTVIALSATVIVLALTGRTGRKTPVPSLVVKAPEPVPAPILPAVAPPVVAPVPAGVEVSIRVLPASAEILLDDGKLSNPFSGRLPRDDLRHRLVLKAAGHRTETSWQVFDRDTRLEISLQKGSGSREASYRPLPTLPKAPPLPVSPAPMVASPEPPRVASPRVEPAPPRPAPVAAPPDVPGPVAASPDPSRPPEVKPDPVKPAGKSPGIYKGTKVQIETEFKE